MADLDIDEINKVRKSLGMAPLPTAGNGNGLTVQSAAASEGSPKEEELDYLAGRHAEAGDNWKKLNDESEAKKSREAKRAQLKKERDAAQRFAKLQGKGLGEGDDDQDTRDWLLGQSKRKKKIEKKRIRRLEEEEEELRKNKVEYTEQDLAGVRVGHDLGDFEEGEQILTLKDADVENDDEEDELENQSLRDKEKLKERLELKKKKSVYNPMDDEEAGSSLLAQYDEEIDGKKKGKAFTLGSTSGGVDESLVGAGPQGQQYSLDWEDSKPTSDYLDISDIKVKKPKKKKKSRKRDDDELDKLPPLEPEVAQPTKRTHDDTFDDDELQANLAAQRRAALKKRKLARPEDLARQLREEMGTDAMDDSQEGGLLIDETSEFVANLQKPEPRRRPEPVERVEPTHEVDAEEMDTRSDGDRAETEAKEEPEAQKITETGLDEEATFTGGVGAALSMLQGRGLIQTADSGDLNAQYRERQRFLTERRQREEEAERRAREQRRSARESGQLANMSAQDRQARAQQENSARTQADSRQLAEIFNREYKPSIELKYVDDFGRSMNQREAFKHLSHQFHGKGSGKQKTEKMLKKIEDEKKREAASSLEGGSGMGNAANVKQQRDRQAGVRLT